MNIPREPLRPWTTCVSLHCTTALLKQFKHVKVAKSEKKHKTRSRAVSEQLLCSRSYAVLQIHTYIHTYIYIMSTGNVSIQEKTTCGPKHISDPTCGLGTNSDPTCGLGRWPVRENKLKDFLAPSPPEVQMWALLTVLV